MAKCLVLRSCVFYFTQATHFYHVLPPLTFLYFPISCMAPVTMPWKPQKTRLCPGLQSAATCIIDAKLTLDSKKNTGLTVSLQQKAQTSNKILILVLNKKKETKKTLIFNELRVEVQIVKHSISMYLAGIQVVPNYLWVVVSSDDGEGPR